MPPASASRPDRTTDLAAAKYVSLTTYRRDGTPVATPVWIAGDEDGKRLVVITESSTGKAKRLRNDPRVRLAVSDGRGRVKAGAEAVDGTAELLRGDDAQRVRALIDSKYGFTAKVLIPVLYKVRDLVRRRPPADPVGILITLEG